ncbi:MAG TPA: LytTR family DNA-binding domain-containing protein [Bacillota bacterium]|nr:LytTR family DNA-binding domain-containing protein [Bacillota bacterium]
MGVNQFIQSLEILNKILPKEVSIAIADSSRYIYYQPSSVIDLKIKPGDDIKEGTLTLKALENRKEISQTIDSHVFGVPYYGTSIPILNNDLIEGCITTIFPAHRTKHNFLVGKIEEGWIPIPYEEILYISSSDGKTFVHTKNGNYQNKYTLSELERILPSDQFLRCHRAFVVNINSIAQIQPDFHSTFLLGIRGKNKELVPVSQKYSSLFRQYLGF